MASYALVDAKKLPFSEKQARYKKVIQNHRMCCWTSAKTFMILVQSFGFPINVYQEGRRSTSYAKRLTPERTESRTPKIGTNGPKLDDAGNGSETKLQWCFQRRGVAFEMCDMVSWDVSQRCLATMFAAYSTDPPPEESAYSNGCQQTKQCEPHQLESCPLPSQTTLGRDHWMKEFLKT